jgi:phosphatidylserine synthase 2
MHAWMCTINILTELMIIIKFSKGEFPEPMPDHIAYFWISGLSSLFIYTVWKFGIKSSVVETSKKLK